MNHNTGARRSSVGFAASFGGGAVRSGGNARSAHTHRVAVLVATLTLLIYSPAHLRSMPSATEHHFAHALAPLPPSLLPLCVGVGRFFNKKVWHALGQCAHATELVLSGWASVGERPLRAAGMRLGNHLTRVDLANTAVRPTPTQRNATHTIPRTMHPPGGRPRLPRNIICNVRGVRFTKHMRAIDFLIIVFALERPRCFCPASCM